VADDFLQHGADVGGADEDGGGPLEALPPPLRKRGVAAHRVLELRAVRLDGVASAGRRAHRPAEEDVVGEDEIRREPLAHGRGVQPDEALALLPREVLEQPRLESLVAVEHENGEQPADVGPHDLGAREVELVGVRLLAEDGEVVPSTAPLPRESPRVDVRPRPAEQISVPEQDPHAGNPTAMAPRATSWGLSPRHVGS
jgi:hypothetical protein